MLSLAVIHHVVTSVGLVPLKSRSVSVDGNRKHHGVGVGAGGNRSTQVLTAYTGRYSLAFTCQTQSTAPSPAGRASHSDTFQISQG